MRQQFLILILTAALLIMGWTIIEYLMQSQIQFHYKQLDSYPIMIYSWDDELVKALGDSIGKYDFVQEIVHKTSEESAEEMIKKYGLTGVEEILKDNTLPEMLIIYLKGSAEARKDKLVLKDMLDNHVEKERMMVEYQSDIWEITFTRIDQLVQIRWIVTAFLALVIFLIFLLKRLHYEHHLARILHLLNAGLDRDKQVSNSYWGNSFLLNVVPIVISYILYRIFYSSDWLIYSISFYFFILQLVVVYTASIVAFPFVVKYKHAEEASKAEQQ